VSNNVNVVVLGGHLTRDVDLRFSGGGVAYTSIGLAVNGRRKQGDEWVDEPCFVDVKLFGKRAEAFAKFHGKGSAALFPRASLKYETWSDKTTGDKRSKLVVHAQDWEFVGEKKAVAAGGSTDDDTPF